MYQKEFMATAAAEADSNLQTNEGGPFGAVVIKDGKIVGKGHNRVLIKHDPTCHAEIEAIRDACQNLNTHDLTGCTLYTSCYPCPMCLAIRVRCVFPPSFGQTLRRFITAIRRKTLLISVFATISSTNSSKVAAPMLP